MTYTRTTSLLLGSAFGTGATIAASASATTSNLPIGSGNSNAEGLVAVAVALGSSMPTTNPTVQFQFTLDGTNYWPDPNALYVVPITTPSVTLYYEYVPPVEAQGSNAIVTNGATNSIASFAQGTLLAVS